LVFSWCPKCLACSSHVFLRSIPVLLLFNLILLCLLFLIL
jgi:hypothetical protein